MNLPGSTSRHGCVVGCVRSGWCIGKWSGRRSELHLREFYLTEVPDESFGTFINSGRPLPIFACPLPKHARLEVNPLADCEPPPQSNAFSSVEIRTKMTQKPKTDATQPRRRTDSPVLDRRIRRSSGDQAAKARGLRTYDELKRRPALEEFSSSRSRT